MLPDFIIIGAMKAGTTSLYRYLNSHPDINGSVIKETNYFCAETNRKRTQFLYELLFSGRGKWAFEASPNYSKYHLNKNVPEKMHNLLPCVKIIYIVRDPIARTFSHYVHNYAHGRESLSFLQAIKKNRNYIDTSRYYYQIQQYLEYFSNEQILIIQAEQLGKRPSATLNYIFSFLDIPAEYDESVIKTRFHDSKNKTRASNLERKLCGTTRNKIVQKAYKNMLAPFRVPFEPPKISEIETAFLKDQLATDVASLRLLTGMTFSGWSV